MNDREKLLKLKSMVKDLLGLMDEEMEHGKYETPEAVPDEYADEEDYYSRHEEITDEVAKHRIALDEFMSTIK